MDAVQVFYKIPDRFPHWPKIVPPFPVKSDEMFAKLICHPPLGQPTVIPSTATNVKFTVALEINASSEKTWEAILWHNMEDQWQECMLKQIDDPHNIVSLYSKLFSTESTNSSSSASSLVKKDQRFYSSLLLSLNQI
jgi:hypothetical protein